MTDQIANKVQDYKDTLQNKAEELIQKGFPEKIVVLNELLESQNFLNRNLTSVYQDLNIPIPDPVIIRGHGFPSKRVKSDLRRPQQGTKVMAMLNGTVPCNKPLCDLIHIVKPHIRRLVEDLNLLKLWISFMIPKIEDGNNFGVSIQEDTLSEIKYVEGEASSFFNKISKYFITRGDMILKVAKFPHIEDYRRAIEEFDEKEYLNIWVIIRAVRNCYSSLHDTVIKNLDKIQKPRSSNAESLY